uniref:Uncharacterized protein n=1 Tax=Fundulus heteroclitus TaxID=8078 RepID=A0A3Q2PPT7_FUNHE
MVLKIFFPQCCNRADSGLLVGRWLSGHDSAVVLAVIHYPFIPGQVKQYIQQVTQSGVELSVLGSWSLPKDGQEGLESFLKDLSTIFPQQRWLQISRQFGQTGFTCKILSRHQSENWVAFCYGADSWHHNLDLGSWGFASLVGNELERVCEVERIQLD